MGGVAGHMDHLHESLELTFNNIIDALRGIANAEIEATEKVDGQNLFISVDSSGELRAARNKGDLKAGGMSTDDYVSKWKGHPAESAFRNGFRAVEMALRSIPAGQLQDLFADGKRYVNLEIIYPSNPNVIVYDASQIVLHSFSSYDESGALVEDPEAGEAFRKLVQAVDKAGAEIDKEIWTVNGPAIVQLQQFTDGSFLKEIESKIKKVAQPLGTNVTLEEYVIYRMTSYLEKIGFPEDKAGDIIARALQSDGAPSVAQIKKGLTNDQKKIVSQLATKTNFRKYVSQVLKPLELAINDFAIEVLRGMSSMFVSDNDKETKRMQDEVQKSIEYLSQLSRDDEKIGQLLQKQMEKLRNIEDVASSMEGIVFEYPPGSGNIKKLTGAFAPVNQLVGRAKRMGMTENRYFTESKYRYSLSRALLSEDYNPGVETVGLVPMSAKPYHIGHHYLVTKAAQENDKVVVFISTSDRKRKGQFPIMGADMKQVWKDHIEPVLPGNVTVQYGGSPVRNVYKMIGEAAEAGIDDKLFRVYSDIEDTSKNYPEKNRQKYMQPLYDAGLVKFAAEEDPSGFTRDAGAPDASGTAVRAALESGNFNEFNRMMLGEIDAEAVYQILGGR